MRSWSRAKGPGNRQRLNDPNQLQTHRLADCILELVATAYCHQPLIGGELVFNPNPTPARCRLCPAYLSRAVEAATFLLYNTYAMILQA